jgi:hypothetical protein
MRMDAPNPFETYRRKTRNRLIAGVVATLVIGGAVYGVLSYFSNERLLRNDRAALDAIRARYCKVLEQDEAGGAKRASLGPDEHATIVGWYSLDMDSISRDEPDGNMDKIERSELESICNSSSELSRGRVLHPLFAELVEPNQKIRDRYEYKGVKRALAAIRRVKYLLFMRLTRFDESVSTGYGTMNPGRYAGKVSLYRLEDAALLGSVDIDANAPSSAVVFKWQNVSEYQGKRDVDLGLSAATSGAMQDSIEGAFSAKGITVKVH